MDERHLLCVRSSLLSGFVPFSQNQAFLSSFSPMKFFIGDSSVYLFTPPHPSPPDVFIHSFTQQLGTIEDTAMAWTGTVFSS